MLSALRDRNQVKMWALLLFCFFFFNDTATTEIYTLSLHDALPIFHDKPMPRLIQEHANNRIKALKLAKSGVTLQMKGVVIQSGTHNCLDIHRKVCK